MGPWAVFLVFLKLGLTSFGGPIAHIGYFHDEFVLRRKWLSEADYAEVVALCQFLPGPASSQVGITLGLLRSGVGGAMAAWLGFTLPSAILMFLCVSGFAKLSGQFSVGLLHGLKIVAVAVVAQAVFQMAMRLCRGKILIILAVAAALTLGFFPMAWMQVLVIVVAGLLGRFLLVDRPLVPEGQNFVVPLTKKTGFISLAGFFTLLLLLPMLNYATDDSWVKLADIFYRVGSLVFGGGHVVLPLLRAEMVDGGWVTNNIFLSGYGAAQAMPGPLFTFASYLGGASLGVGGAVVAVIAIFLPSFLLTFGVLPFWQNLRTLNGMTAALMGINAAVVGLLLAAFINPVWMSAILSSRDFFLALSAIFTLMVLRQPPWLVVVLVPLTTALLGL